MEEFLKTAPVECPKGCNYDDNCCQCCIYVHNLSEQEKRQIIVEERYERLLTDPAYCKEQATKYKEQIDNDNQC